MIELTLNGEKVMTASATVGAFLNEHQLTAKKIAVEVNRQVISRDRFADTALSDGDVIEIVQFVGGG